MTKKNTKNAKTPSAKKGSTGLTAIRAAKYGELRLEEDIKNNVHADWFAAFDYKPVEKMDFCVFSKSDADKPIEERTSFLWAESKLGTKHDISESLVQMILTIGKAHAYTRYQPPKFIGAFDAQQIAFLPYDAIHDIFRINDFDWKRAARPSDHGSKEFRLVFDRVKNTLESGTFVFDFLKDAKELARFIKDNFTVGGDGDLNLIQIDKTNFTHVYAKWRDAVLPTIDVDWVALRKRDIIDADFFLADLFSNENATVMERLNVLLERNHYKQRVAIKDDIGLGMLFTEIPFKDGQSAYNQFWRRYKRPPAEAYWDYIVHRRDLLVPQDIREREGSFFTPQKWVQLSQEYLAKELGADWQDEYYIWDCCAGTGNMEAGLVNKHNVWASTLVPADVDVIRQRIRFMEETAHGSSNLLDSHVFQFDFLNDSFDKLPENLKAIIDDPEKRKKLIIYINPPYAEGDSRVGKGRSGVAVSDVHKKYSDKMGYAKRELFVQFLTRIHAEITGCIIGEFSKLKVLQAPKFADFRKFFAAKLERVFIVPADTFDNVEGQFPIGFKVWNTSRQETFTGINADVFDADGKNIGKKTLISYDGIEVINDWIVRYSDKRAETKGGDSIGTALAVANDFQHQNTVNLSMPYKPWNHQFQWQVSIRNLIPSVIYLAVRLSMSPTWQNDRDQFLSPNIAWEKDLAFQGDCLAYILFHGQNRISGKDGTNHWIPFTAAEVGANDNFKSTIMSDYLAGKVEPPAEDDDLFSAAKRKRSAKPKPVKLSREAKAVMAAGRELWRYYHKQPKATPNASFYDIRLHFQGMRVTAKGKEMMNSDSSDATYTKLLAKLRTAHKALAKAIEPKVYEYGFLKR